MCQYCEKLLTCIHLFHPHKNTLWGPCYYYPHFTDERIRFWAVKKELSQNVIDRRWQSQDWNQVLCVTRAGALKVRALLPTVAANTIFWTLTGHCPVQVGITATQVFLILSPSISWCHKPQLMSFKRTAILIKIMALLVQQQNSELGIKHLNCMHHFHGLTADANASIHVPIHHRVQ